MRFGVWSEYRQISYVYEGGALLRCWCIQQYNNNGFSSPSWMLDKTQGFNIIAHQFPTPNLATRSRQARAARKRCASGETYRHSQQPAADTERDTARGSVTRVLGRRRERIFYPTVPPPFSSWLLVGLPCEGVASISARVCV